MKTFLRIFQGKDPKDGETGKTAGKALERTFEKTKDMRRKTRKYLQCFKQKPPAFSPKTLNVFEENAEGFYKSLSTDKKQSMYPTNNI